MAKTRKRKYTAVLEDGQTIVFTGPKPEIGNVMFLMIEDKTVVVGEVAEVLNGNQSV